MIFLEKSLKRLKAELNALEADIRLNSYLLQSEFLEKVSETFGQKFTIEPMQLIEDNIIAKQDFNTILKNVEYCKLKIMPEITCLKMELQALQTVSVDLIKEIGGSILQNYFVF